MVISLVFTLSACRKGNNSLSSSDIQPTVSTSATDEFVKPTDYACVLLISINPQFKLYLDDNNKVLAIEAVNEDAKSIESDIDFDTDFDTVIQRILTVSNEKGFIKANATIDFEMTEVIKTIINIADVLNKAVAAANKTATDLSIAITVTATDKTSSGTQTDSNDTPANTSSNSNSGTNTQSNTSSKTPTPSTATSSSSGKNNQTTHTHSYSNATCTEPAKCSCGATNGNALGHNWQAATCKAPKTCNTCKITEGSIAAHNFVDGQCLVCKIADCLNPKTYLISGKEYVGYFRLEGDMLIASALQFEDDVCVNTERYFSPEPNDPSQTPIQFNNKNYYSEGGGHSPYKYELTDTEVIVTCSYYADTDEISLKATLLNSGMLKVTYSTFNDFPVGTLLSINIDDVI